MQSLTGFVLLAVAYNVLALPFKNVEVGDITEDSSTQTISSLPTPMIFAKAAWDVERRQVTGPAPIFAKDQWEVVTSVHSGAAASTAAPIVLSPAIFAKEAWEIQKRGSAASAIFAKDQWEIDTNNVVDATPTSLPAARIFAKDQWEIDSISNVDATPTPLPAARIFAKEAWETD
ncbi:hypothetical protein C8J55DRAFT_563604 [Lentinula edodes]|uniref:Uncharacterized protein n=1 Tax=Lentinula lateritia TaxID=40482 RepID=A0A9W8ZZV6_9AGAR|nr:hypothetical protein C8J55DRAFT_563604 [Lentinula edodes]